MSAGTLVEPTLESVESLLRDALAQGDAVLSSSAPVLRHLLAHQDNALFSDEVVARTRGLLVDMASQLLDALAEAIPAADPASFLAERRDTLVKALADEPALLAHLHATVVEGILALRIEARGGTDPVLCPLLQELVASRDDATAGIAMAVLAAQARFILQHREMTLPLGELPEDLFQLALHTLQSHAGKRDEGALAARNLGQRFDESHGRLGLIAQLVARIGELATTLDVRHAGLAIFATNLAAASGQKRDLCLLSLADGRSARLALTMRAAGLSQAEVENQFLHLDADVTLPEGFAALSRDRASQLLRGSQPGE